MPVLFVYGTLRRPAGGPPGDTHYHERIAATIEVAQMATLFGAAIYDLGNYPGIGPAESSASIRGEVFEVTDDGLAIADEIEGHPNFYVRQESTVVLDNGTGGAAWVYWAPTALLEGRTPIPSGDWFDRGGDGGAAKTATAVSIEDQLAAERARIEG